MVEIISVESLLPGIFVDIAFRTACKLIFVKSRHLRRALELAEKRNGYRPKRIRKKRGGMREIHAPHDDLKWVQRALYHNLLLKKYIPSSICHSFVPRVHKGEDGRDKVGSWGRSIVSNAYAHLGIPADIKPDPDDDELPWRNPRSLFSVDLKDAYPSVKYERVEKIYRKILGDEEIKAPIAKIFTDLSTRRGILPQGAPTSPVLFNFACSELDKKLEAEFNRSPFVITRYVDDIVLSSCGESVPREVQRKLTNIILDNGYKIKAQKTCHWNIRQHALNVTGINLDPTKRKVSLPPKTRDLFRYLIRKFVLTLKEGNSEWFDKFHGEPDISFIEYIRKNSDKRYWQAVSRVCGVISICAMVYGQENIPKRIFEGIAETSGDWGSAKEFLRYFLDLVIHGEFSEPIYWWWNEAMGGMSG